MELSIVYFLQQLGTGTLFDIIMKFISSSYFFTIFGLICITITLRKNKKQRKKVLISFAVSGLLFYLISELFFKHILVDFTGIKLRPYIAHSDLITAIGTAHTDSSFPSSHMTITLALLTVVVFFRRKTWIYAIIIGLAMAVSRMHNGMHYPIDVFVGAVLGVLCGLGGVKVGKLITGKSWNNKKLSK